MTDTTITAVQMGMVAADTCVRVEAVVMSPVFDDPDDAFGMPGMQTPRKAFYISVKGLTATAPYTGIEVVANTDITQPTVVPGDDITLTATYSEHFDNSTLRMGALCGALTVNGNGLALPSAAPVTLAQVGHSGGGTTCPSPMPPWTEGTESEAYEGVLFQVTAGSVTAGPAFGAFEVGDNGYVLLVPDTLGTTIVPTQGDLIGAGGVTGFGHFSFCRRKVRPRSDADIDIMPDANACGTGPVADHLLITEARIGPSGLEFVELHNPTASEVDLTDYRLYNATYVDSAGMNLPCHYWDHVTNTACGVDFGDFDLSFPTGASILAGGYVIIALTGAQNYCANNACPNAADMPDFEIPPPAAGCTVVNDVNVPDMLGTYDPDADQFCATGGGPGGFGFLTSSSEDLVLYRWNGNNMSLVADVDYFVWGTNTSVRSDKTDVMTYAADTGVDTQSAPAGSISNALSFQRRCYNEGTEALTAGNGVTGHNETSENLASTFVTAAPTPKAGTVGAQP